MLNAYGLQFTKMTDSARYGKKDLELPTTIVSWILSRDLSMRRGCF